MNIHKVKKKYIVKEKPDTIYTIHNPNLSTHKHMPIWERNLYLWSFEKFKVWFFFFFSALYWEVDHQI